MTARRAVVAAVVLWLVFAGVVWNVVFDRMVVLAGRRYVHDALTWADCAVWIENQNGERGTVGTATVTLATSLLT